MTVDSQGRIYVADAGNNRIQVLDAQGEFLDEWRDAGAGESLLHPIYIALDRSESHAYVLDLSPHVRKFDTEGNFVTGWGEYGLAPGQFHSPLKIGIGLDDSVYVSDEALNRVSKFDPDGELLLHFGRHGSGPGEFYLPQGVAVDAQSRVWVVDYGNHRGQTFTDQGEFLFVWGEDLLFNPDAGQLPVPLLAGAGVGLLLGITTTVGVVRLVRRRSMPKAREELV